MNYLEQLNRLQSTKTDYEKSAPDKNWSIKEWSDANDESKRLMRDAILEIFDKVETNRNVLGDITLAWEWERLYNRARRDPESGMWSKDFITNLSFEEKTWKGEEIHPCLPTYESTRYFQKGGVYIHLEVFTGKFGDWFYLDITKRQLENIDGIIAELANTAMGVHARKMDSLRHELENVKAKYSKCVELVEKGKVTE